MNELSIFIDESGDFGGFQKHSPYYIVTAVFHNQSNNINPELEKLNRELSNLGYKNPIIHTRPLIRREDDYSEMTPNERRAIFSKLFFFAKRCDIKYKTFLYAKKEFSDVYKLQARIAKAMSQFMKDNMGYFYSFDRVILYYDNGQHELSRILNIVLATVLPDYDTREAMQKDYRLSQVADLLCTLEQMKQNLANGIHLSNSEMLVFHNARQFKKDFLKPLKDLEF